MPRILTPHGLQLLVLAAAFAVVPARALNHDLAVPPIAAGRFPVACSNVAQDPARIALLGGAPIDYWEGRPNGGQSRYITEILTDLQSVVRFDAAVPDDPFHYPIFAGGTVPFVAIVCHPTPRANADPDYALPGSQDQIPHMQPASAAPKLISASEYLQTLGLAGNAPPLEPARLPLIVFSHGLSGSPISPGYIGAMVQLASLGYMVGAVFHADQRFSRVRVQDLADFWYLLRNFDLVVEMQLMRPLSIQAMIDRLLADPGFAPGIDTERIGGFGASLGGEAMAHLLGARITTNFGAGCYETARDPRIKAAVGFVPYAGQSFLPTFCDDQSGAADVDRPFLALSGTADTTAPIKVMEEALGRFRGSRYLVELVGVAHEYRPEYAGDLFTWMVTFLNAYLDVRSDPGAMARLIRMRSVQGGPEDNLIADVHVPFASAAGETLAKEFHNTRLNHYFMAAGPDEIANLLGGRAGPGWELTGQSFKVWPQPPSDTSSAAAAVCRFYGTPAGGPNSHFFTVSSSECDTVKRSGGWLYEGIGFYIRPVQSDGRCPDGLLAVNRAYNNGFVRNDSNHRFSTSDSTMREMRSAGWTVEGAVMCAKP